jgi:hypothetical protein
MKKILYMALALLSATVALTSCDEEETYADQKEREARQIRKWISDNNIDVISLSDFLKDTITNNPITGPDFTRNEYVLFEDNGVYMQIIRRGTGRLMESGDRWNINARYVERYVSNGDTLSTNVLGSSDGEPDIMFVERTGGNYSARFKSGVMYKIYGSPAVPSSWIMVMPYIKPGNSNGERAALVRLIVPHNQGTQTASANVYPAFYEISLFKQKFQK